MLGFLSVESWTSFKYPGIPISLRNPTSQIWQDILLKIGKQIQQWGAIWLNPMIKIVLIKYVLPSLPLY
jgi:hypothetical protein